MDERWWILINYTELKKDILLSIGGKTMLPSLRVTDYSELCQEAEYFSMRVKDLFCDVKYL